MTHSHLSIRHLIKQIESDRSRRSKRDVRPAWLKTFIDSVAERFEPREGLGRVGFDCRLDENGWSVAMYLGAVELVGGREDGQRRPVEFRFDLQSLAEQFTTVTSYSWTVVPRDGRTGDGADGSRVEVDGWIGTDRVRLTVHSTPPDAIGPGMRRLPGGRLELA